MGDEIDLRQWGYLFLLDRADDVDLFRAALALQHSLGVPSAELDANGAQEIVPQLDVDGVLAATYCPLDGYCSPESAVQWYARGAAHGARIRQGCAAHRRPRPRRQDRRCRDAAGRSRRPRSSAPPAPGRREIARARRARAPGPGRASASLVHVAGRRTATRAAAHRRLLDQLLLPSRGAGARLRRPGAAARGRRRGGRASAARADRPADRVVVVGLLRGLARSQRTRRRERPRARASSTRPASPATASSRRRRSASTWRNSSRASPPPSTSRRSTSSASRAGPSAARPS